MVEVKLPLELPDGDGSLVKMTDLWKVYNLTKWCNINTLSGFNTFMKKDLEKFWPKLVLSASSTYKFLE